MTISKSNPVILRQTTPTGWMETSHMPGKQKYGVSNQGMTVNGKTRKQNHRFLATLLHVCSIIIIIIMTNTWKQSFFLYKSSTVQRCGFSWQLLTLPSSLVCVYKGLIWLGKKKKRTYFYCPPLALTWAAWKELRPLTAWEQLTYWITGGKNHLYSVTLWISWWYYVLRLLCILLCYIC